MFYWIFIEPKRNTQQFLLIFIEPKRNAQKFDWN